MSTNSTAVGSTLCGLTISASAFRRGSGTGTTPTFGSIVQNGKLAAAMPALVNALKRVDLPTLGRPTMPHLMPMWIRDLEFGIRDSGKAFAFPNPESPIPNPCSCRSEEHTSELQSLMRISYAVFCLKQKK